MCARAQALTILASGVEVAVALSTQPTPSHRIPYRAILLDRTLRALGVGEDDIAPPGVLQQFEAKTRRRLELYYKPAHVCTSCSCWCAALQHTHPRARTRSARVLIACACPPALPHRYDRQSRRRAAELDGDNSPLLPVAALASSSLGLSNSAAAAIAMAQVSDAELAGRAEEGTAVGGSQAAPLLRPRRTRGGMSGVNAPVSLARAMMRASASMPALPTNTHHIPAAALPQPAHRGSNRIARVQLPRVGRFD